MLNYQRVKVKIPIISPWRPQMRRADRNCVATTQGNPPRGGRQATWWRSKSIRGPKDGHCDNLLWIYDDL